MQNSTPKLSASTDISTLSKDSEIGKVLSLRWKRIESASAKSILDFDKPLGDLLCKLRAALDADQKQIPSKTLNVNNLNKIDRRRRSEAERLARDWNVVVSHIDGKTVGEIAESKQFSSTTALLAAVDKPEREAKAAEKKAEKEAAKAEAETEEAAKAEEASKPMTADEIVFEAMLLCSVNRVSDADFIAAVKRQITMLSEAA
tara:strand:- start:731 stop:1339 length:609 start_codon:yes stop_codon:yes gene_type:complete